MCAVRQPLMFTFVEVQALAVLAVDILGRSKETTTICVDFAARRPPQDDDMTNEAVRVASARTNKSGINWARRNVSDGSTGSGNAPSSPLPPAGGRRLVIFVIGGVTRSEMRSVHQLSRSLNREVLLASTNVWKPSWFADSLSKLSALEDL